MINQEIAFEMYRNHVSIHGTESFEEFTSRILHGFELSQNNDFGNSYHNSSESDKRDYELALNYNKELMTLMLSQ